MKEIFKFEQTGALTLVSVIIYISVATMIFEYIISREMYGIIQIASLTGLLFYTIWQIRYVAKYFIKLFNL